MIRYLGYLHNIFIGNQQDKVFQKKIEFLVLVFQSVKYLVCIIMVCIMVCIMVYVKEFIDLKIQVF